MVRCDRLAVGLFGAATALALACPASAQTPPRPETATSQAPQVTAEESRIVELARRDTPEAIALLERIVNIPSATQNLDGVRAVGKVFEEGRRRPPRRSLPDFDAAGMVGSSYRDLG
ncbi:MAG: hypothetical protein U0794_22635 [Isosphaeraceae bacterium]